MLGSGLCPKHGMSMLFGRCSDCERENMGIVFRKKYADTAAKTLPHESIVTALIGWRKWRPVMFGEGLYSMNGSFLWTPKKKAVSSCSRGAHCAGTQCDCGIHAFKGRPDVEAQYGSVDGLIGEVYLWGRVLECEKGYRAQFAYPKSFLSTSPFAETYAAEFGVKVVEP